MKPSVKEYIVIRYWDYREDGAILCVQFDTYEEAQNYKNSFENQADILRWNYVSGNWEYFE